MRALAMTGTVTAALIASIIAGSLMRATPPSRRMSAGTRSSAITATAPASSAILACSGVTTSMITPPLSISANPRLTRSVPVVRGASLTASSYGRASRPRTELPRNGQAAAGDDLDPGGPGGELDRRAGGVGEAGDHVGVRLRPAALDELAARQHPRLAAADDVGHGHRLAGHVDVAGVPVARELEDDVGNAELRAAGVDVGRAVHAAHPQVERRVPAPVDGGAGAHHDLHPVEGGDTRATEALAGDEVVEQRRRCGLAGSQPVERARGAHEVVRRDAGAV